MGGRSVVGSLLHAILGTLTSVHHTSFVGPSAVTPPEENIVFTPYLDSKNLADCDHAIIPYYIGNE